MRFILTAVLALLGLRALDHAAGDTGPLMTLISRTISAIQHSPQVSEVFGNPSLLLGAIYLLVCYGWACELMAMPYLFRFSYTANNAVGARQDAPVVTTVK